MGEHTEGNTISRRKVIAGIAGVLGGAVLTKTGVEKMFGNAGEKQKVPDTPPPPMSTPSPTEVPPIPTEKVMDEVPIDTETVEYVLPIYAPDMDQRAFPTEKEKRAFFEKVTQVVETISPNNPNAANQLLSVMNFETNGTFSPTLQNMETGSVGIFQLTPANCKELGVEVTTVLGMSAHQQLDLVEMLLKKRLQTESGESRSFSSVSDMWLAKSYPNNIGESAKTILFSEGSDAYQRYLAMDLYKDHEITKGCIDEAIITKAIQKGDDTNPGEKVQLLMDISKRTLTIDQLREADQESEGETRTHLPTATHLLKLYENIMKDSFYTDEEYAISQEKKLLFFKELTRVAKRLNPDNENLANQLAAAILYESDGSFSSYAQNSLTLATGLIQFMPDTAHSMNTSFVRLAQLSPIDQLYYVEAFLRGTGQENLWDISDVYMAIFLPSAVGKSNDFVIANKDGNRDEKDRWEENNVFHPNGEKIVTKLMATQQIIDRAVGAGEKIDFLAKPANAPSG